MKRNSSVVRETARVDLVPSLVLVLTSQEVTQKPASLGRDLVIDVTHAG